MIRTIRTEDVKHVVDIWLSASILAHDFIEYGFWYEKTGALLAELSSSRGYVCDNDDHVVGFVLLRELAETEAYIGELFIDPRYQRRGYGQALLDQAKRLYSTLRLHVYKENNKAVRFYQHRDFRVDGEHKEAKTDQTKLRMIWDRRVG